MAVSFNYLKSNALWLVMDPWIYQPNDDGVRDRCPEIDQLNYAVFIEIEKILDQLTHVISCCYHEVYEPLRKYLITDDNPKFVKRYTKQHGIKHMVYIGYHYGRCILFRNTGALWANEKGFRTWVYRPLCAIHPDDNWDRQDYEVNRVCPIIESYDSQGMAVIKTDIKQYK